jgi:RNA polymerase sigma factor (sigma-70 family)
MRNEDQFRAYVDSRLESLRRTAYLLCRDWHLADDLVAVTIGKLYRHWRRVSEADNVDAYARGVLTNAWLDELRKPWRRRERVTDDLPDRAATHAGPEDIAARPALGPLLDSLPPRRRAVLVLRFYCDLSVEETAPEPFTVCTESVGPRGERIATRITTDPSSREPRENPKVVFTVTAARPDGTFLAVYIDNITEKPEIGAGGLTVNKEPPLTLEQIPGWRSIPASRSEPFRRPWARPLLPGPPACGRMAV